MGRRQALIAAAIVTLAGVLFWVGTRTVRRPDGAAPAGPVMLRLFSTPTAVAHFTARDLDGQTITAASLRGKVTIVNFWATWCPPCRAEIPDLIALQEKYRGQLLVIGISQDEETADFVKQFALAQHINYPIVMSTPELEKVFPGVYALPTSFIIDREGLVVQKHVGLLDPVTTELETRYLAGLDVNTTIERVEADEANRKLIKDAAQATKIPGLDLDMLSPAARAACLQRLNSDTCTCGCGLTLAACRINDPGCGISLPLAEKIVQEAAKAQP
ncbi:MAG: redoxin domain-containing protein [Vicinamibacterales bacterium]